MLAWVVMAQLLAPQSIETQFVELMSQRKTADAVALFSDEVKAKAPVAVIEQAWTSQTASLGAFKKLGEASRKAMGERELFVRRVEFEKGAVQTFVTVNSRLQKIEGFQIKPAPLPYLPAPYAVAAAFRSVEVTFGTKGFELPGTVLVPTGKGPFPAVVLVHGSGPNDRDESQGANKPFRDLAEGLASKGVLVFRYDKRTLVHGAKMTAPTIDTETVDDAVAAVALLRTRADVDGKRVTVVGHSLGAQLGPQIAKTAKASRLVLLAPPARTPWQILPQQYRYLGVPEADVVVLETKLNAVRDGKSEEAVMGAPAAYWRDWASRDGLAVAKTLTVPMLVMHGERDYQVIEEDAAAWRKGLQKAKHLDIAGANHLFITGTGKPGPKEYEVPGHVASEVVNAIAAFVTAK